MDLMSKKWQVALEKSLGMAVLGVARRGAAAGAGVMMRNNSADAHWPASTTPSTPSVASLLPRLLQGAAAGILAA